MLLADRPIVKEIIDRNDNANKEKLISMKRVLTLAFGAENIELTKNLPTNEDAASISDSSAIDYINDKMRGDWYIFIIRFPHITITSESGATHEIKNLFLKFRMTKDLKLRQDIQGLRTSFTIAEWNSNYSHSHLSGRSLNWNRFCTGSGPINQSMAILMGGYNEIEFQLFSMHINSYVRYESIEGTPYNYIRNITAGNRVSAQRLSYSTWLEDDLCDVWDESIKELFTPATYKQLLNPMPVYKDGKFNVVETDTLSQLFAERLSSFVRNVRGDDEEDAYEQIDLSVIITQKTADGVYVPIGNNGGAYEFTRSKLLTFKKVDYYTTIIDQVDPTQINNCYIHPLVLTYYCKKLSNELTSCALRPK